MQPSYVQKSAEIYLANLTDLALIPNFPFRILHPRKGFVRMPHATMGSQTNVASMEFKFSAQHYTVIPYTVILANWSLLALPKLEFHSLKSPTTFGSYHGHLWLARNALEARCCPETNRKETSVHAVHAVHDRSALGTGLRPFHGTGNCHERHRQHSIASLPSPIFAFWFQTCFLLLLSLECIAVDDVTFPFLLFGWGRLP